LIMTPAVVRKRSSSDAHSKDKGGWFDQDEVVIIPSP